MEKICGAPHPAGQRGRRMSEQTGLFTRLDVMARVIQGWLEWENKDRTWGNDKQIRMPGQPPTHGQMKAWITTLEEAKFLESENVKLKKEVEKLDSELDDMWFERKEEW